MSKTGRAYTVHIMLLHDARHTAIVRLLWVLFGNRDSHDQRHLQAQPEVRA